MNADCIIVGAGPAGSSLAMRLAQSGADVLLLDRSVFPRSKACGDCLSPQANLLLDELGVFAQIEALDPARLCGWQIISPNGTSFCARFDSVTRDARLTRAIAVERSRLDAVLLNAASKAGARIETGVHVVGLVYDAGAVCGVEIRDHGGSFRTLRAPLVVGADGLRSTVRARLGAEARPPRLRKFSLTCHVEHVDGLRDYGEMHLRDGGCIGLAPVGHGGANLTIVADSTRYAEQVRTSAGSFIERFIADAPALAARINAAQLRNVDVLASGPFDRPVSAVSQPGVALVGDAAGYFDPFTGQGIYQALAGSKLLALAIREYGFTAGALARYRREHRGLMRGPRTIQRLIDAVCAQPARADRWIGFLSRAPEAAAVLVAVTGDLLPPRALLSPRVLVSLLARTSAGGPPEDRR